MYSSFFEPLYFSTFLGKTTPHKYLPISAKSELSEQRAPATWIRNGWLNGKDALKVRESELLWRDLKTSSPRVICLLILGDSEAETFSTPSQNILVFLSCGANLVSCSCRFIHHSSCWYMGHWGMGDQHYQVALWVNKMSVLW